MLLLLRTGVGIERNNYRGVMKLLLNSNYYLGEITMQDQTSTAPAIHTVPISAAISKSVQLVSAMLLGIVILYGVGFVQTSAAHNAAHDMRHSQGFPCH